MNNKGFTTIELILAIAIAGIIMGAVGSFLTFNLRGFNMTKDIIDIQYEGQLAMNQLSNIAKESTGIMAIENSASIDLKGTFVEAIPAILEFHHFEEVSGLEEQTTYRITYDTSNANNHKLLMDITNPDGSTVPQYLLGQYLTSFTLEPTNGRDFENTRSMVIRMVFKDKKANMDLQTEVKFRNKQ